MIRAYNKPFVNVNFMMPIIGEDVTNYTTWLNTTKIPYTMIKNKYIYIEQMAFGRILKENCKKKVYDRWMIEIQKDDVGRNLSKTDKIRVAASQKWKCANCKILLPATFEVDHVEEWCLRHKEEVLQALCPNCHRQKSYWDINIGNAYFGKECAESLELNEQNRKQLTSNSDTEQENIFSEYFKH